MLVLLSKKKSTINRVNIMFRLQNKLNQSGFDHILVALAFVVLIALGGTYFLVVSHAYSSRWKGSLEEGGATSGFCLSTSGGTNGSKVVLNSCAANVAAQTWSLNYIKKATVMGLANVQEFTLQSSSGSTECLNNPYGSKTNGTQLQIYTCHSNDTNNLWVWGGALTGKGYGYRQLVNVATVSGTSGLCLDDTGSSHAANNKVEIWSCTKPAPTNQSWYESSSSTSGGGSSTGGSGASGGSNMIIGMNINGMTSNTATDFAGAAKYMRVDLKSWGQNATTFSAAGIKVDDILQGPYSTSGIAGLGNATIWANNALGWYKTDGCTPTICPMVEILNEPGGHWFWGNNAMTASNASAYDNVLVATYNAFKAAYGSSSPLVLASFDGGMSDGSGGWGQYMWQANKSIGNYINGITVHPYNQQSTDLGYQTNVTGAYSSAKSLSGKSIPVYITEIGWQTTPASADNGDPPLSGIITMSAAQQCSNVYNYVSWARGLGYVNAVMFFDYRDDNASLGDGTYGMEYGNGTHKPAYNALTAAVQNKANPC